MPLFTLDDLEADAEGYFRTSMAFEGPVFGALWMAAPEGLCAELAATKGDVARALARYNGGPTGERIGEDGKMRRQEYVDKVLVNARRVAEDRL